MSEPPDAEQVLSNAEPGARVAPRRHQRRATGLLLLRLEDLVAVWQECGPLDHDEAVIERAVAVVAAGAELIERSRERRAIFVLDGLLQRLDRIADHLIHGVAAEQFVDVLKSFVQLAHLVIGERPVPGAAGEPQLDVAQLLQGHDLAESGEVAAIGRRLWVLRAGSNGGEQRYR